MTETTYDILVLGGGPAGISAALTARARGRSVLVVSNPAGTSSLAKAHRIDNYPGLTGMSGADMLAAMAKGLEELAIPVVTGRATGVMPLGSSFMVSVGTDVYTAAALILAAGAAQPKAYPGEAELLGRGVSYCATCDGMLYRGRKVAVIGLSADAAEEAEFLTGIGCEVEFFDRGRARRFAVKGADKVEALIADDAEYPVDGVFILRDTVASTVLLPSLALDGGHIAADRAMATSVPGVFAAGDCVGRPYQIAKAVGEGNVAALSADAYIKRLSQPGGDPDQTNK